MQNSPGADGHIQRDQPFYIKYRDLIHRMMFLIGALLVFRLGVHIPLPGIDNNALAEFFKQNEGTFVGLFNMFSGGALERMSIFALGIMPYITSSIVIQLVTSIVPKLESLKKEGEQGRRKINQYTRYGTLILALIQSFGISAGLISQHITSTVGLAFFVPAVTSLVAGTMFLMWLGEQITERGVGNGISMLIFAGIVASLPTTISQFFPIENSEKIIPLLVLGALSLSVLVGVVYIEKAQRRVTVNYAQKQQDRRLFSAQQSHLPFKINMAGVIPVIFASSLLMVPASLGQWLGDPNAGSIKSLLQDISIYLAYGQPLYIALFSALIIFFCYFYSALMFNPKEIADNLKRSGAYVPGIRPGEQTARYLDTVLGRLTFIGSIYITVICVLPMILQTSFSLTSLHIQGTSLLIIVVVIMDFITQLQSHLTSHQYTNQTLMKKNIKFNNE